MNENISPTAARWARQASPTGRLGAARLDETLSHKRIIGRGGMHSPLDDEEISLIHDTAILLLAETGLSEPAKAAVDMVTAAGGFLDDEHRLRFPETWYQGQLQDCAVTSNYGDAVVTQTLIWC